MFAIKTMKEWLIYAFDEMKLEEIPYSKLKPGRAIVKTKVVQPSTTEVQLVCWERSNSHDKVKKSLGLGLQQLSVHEFCAEIVEPDSGNGCSLSVGERVGATHTEPGTIERDLAG